MKEWWWTRLLVEAGHRFEHGEWRCADCRRRVCALLAKIDPCKSPTNAGFVFIGGPMDGEWIDVPNSMTVFEVALPLPPPTAIGVDQPPLDVVSYRLTPHRVRRTGAGEKLLYRYVFEG